MDAEEILGFKKAGISLLNMLKAHELVYEAIKAANPGTQVGSWHMFTLHGYSLCRHSVSGGTILYFVPNLCGCLPVVHLRLVMNLYANMLHASCIANPYVHRLASTPVSAAVPCMCVRSFHMPLHCEWMQVGIVHQFIEMQPHRKWHFHTAFVSKWVNHVFAKRTTLEWFQHGIYR